MQLHDDVRVRTRFTPGNERYLLLDVSQFESDHPGKLNSTAAMLRVGNTLPQPHILHPTAQTLRHILGRFPEN
jgi:hypothetical protein